MEVLESVVQHLIQRQTVGLVGGGGGYYGGGSGKAHAAGGGGSGYINTSKLKDASTTENNHSGNGQAKITLVN